MADERCKRLHTKRREESRDGATGQCLTEHYLLSICSFCLLESGCGVPLYIRTVGEPRFSFLPRVSCLQPDD